MRRRAFVAGVTAAAVAASVPALGWGDTLRVSLGKADWDHVAETLRRLRLGRFWRPASAFPKYSPLALYKPRGSDPQHPDFALLWINVDHRELMTPRISHPDDEDPAIAQTMIGAADLPLESPTWQKLRAVFRAAAPNEAAFLALNLAPFVRESFGNDPPTPHVSDDEFAAEAFPFEVVRNMTPGVPGVEVDGPPPGSAMPAGAPLIAYVGRTDGRHAGAPVIWGDDKTKAAQGTPEFADALMRAYILATADMRPADSAEKRGYDEARARDAAAGAGSFTARNAFAAAYLSRVRALVSH